MTALPAGTPIVCRNCGGAMRPLEGGEGTSVLCPYCGARDVLPEDEAGRYLEIKNRLAFARSKTAQVTGMEAALARIFEDRGAFMRVSGLYLAVGFVVTGMTIASVYQSTGAMSAAVPDGLRAQIWLSSLSGPLMSLGMAGSFGVALLVGRMHYRRHVRPLLLARPLSGGGGAQFGCRACGAPLATGGGGGTDAAVTCRHCTTVNLVPSALHARHAAAIDERGAAAARQVQSAHVKASSIGSRMTLVLALGIATTVGLAYALPTVLGGALGATAR